MSIVVNSTPLISLAIIDKLELLPKIFDAVLVPRAVHEEVVLNGTGKGGYNELAQAKWLQIFDVENTHLKRSIMIELDEGEAEVITLAKEREINRVCIDEFAGRKYAKLLGLDVIGTLGLLLIAKNRGYVNKIKPLLDELIVYNRYIAQGLYNEVLKKAHEL